MITLRPSQAGSVDGQNSPIVYSLPGQVREYENREYPDKQRVRSRSRKTDKCVKLDTTQTWEEWTKLAERGRPGADGELTGTAWCGKNGEMMAWAPDPGQPQSYTDVNESRRTSAT